MKRKKIKHVLLPSLLLLFASCQESQHVYTPMEREIMGLASTDTGKKAFPANVNKEENQQNEVQARLIVFWKMVGSAKMHEQIPNQLNSLIYEIIAKRYPSLPHSEIMAKFETIDEDAAIQEDVLSILYSNYAHGNYAIDKHNLNIVFDDLCLNNTMGHWVADYVLERHGIRSDQSPEQSPSDFKPNLHF